MVTDQKCWNFTDVMTSVSTKCTFILAEEALVWHNFSDLNYVRGCSSVVERSLCMWKARGSIPRISTHFALRSELKFIEAVVAEWLRRWTWNPMGSARVGSNPANCDNILTGKSTRLTQLNKSFIPPKNASCGDWTHDPWFTRPVLYHWATQAIS